MSRRPYLTASRVDAIARVLSDQDWLLVDDLARLRVASGRQMRALHFPAGESGARASRRAFRRLTDLRVFQRLGRRVGGVRAGSDGFVFALDVVGQRLVAAQSRRRWWPAATPSERTMAHRLATSELYVELRDLERAAEVELVEFEAEPDCWRPFTGPGGGRLVLKPDASAITAAGDLEHHWFIETDRATESLPWILTKTRQYVRYWQTGREQARHGLFPKVLWVAPEDHRAQQLTDALATLPADHWQLFAVTTADRAAWRLAGLEHATDTIKEVTS